MSLTCKIALDADPREIALPPDLAAALDRQPKVRKYFGGLSYSKQKAFVSAVEGAKTTETRHRRLDKAVADLRAAMEK